ncbi:MAG TPA: VOC family protein, partial [Saliniramus sp.]|nr:VOC family protein [Saliniramus sp.]
MIDRQQLPTDGEVFLDHLAHFVPDMTAAEQVLAGLGFILTPFTAQNNRTPNGLVPAGTGNRCAMLRNGYLEFLTATSDTIL